MADIEKSIKLNVDAGDSIESLGRLRRELATLNAEIESADRGSESFKKLENQIKNTESAIKRAEGAFGDASDKIKTLSGSAVERANASFGLLREGITSLDFGKFKIGLQGITGGFRALGGAIAATGIGLLVTGVVALIANFDKLKNMGGLVGEVFTFIGDTITGIINGITELSDAIGLTDTKAAAAQERADARNKKAIEERLDLVNKVKKSYEDQIAVAKAAGKDTTDLENKSADAQKQILKTNIAYLENIAKQSTFFADIIEPVLNGQKAKLAELDQEEKVRNANRIKEAQDTAKELKKTQEEKDKERLDALAKEASDLLDSQERARIAGEKFTADMKAADEKSLNDLAAMADAEINLLMESNERKAAAEKAYTDMIKEENDKRLESEQKLQDLKFEAVLAGFNLISDLTSVFAGKSEKAQKRAFNIQKGISIATTTIETYLAAQKAYTSQLIPGDPTSPVRGAFAAAIAVAGGLARVAKIAATKFEGGGGGGGNEPSPTPPTINSSSSSQSGGGSVAPPMFNLGGQQIGGASNMLGGGPGGFTQQPIRVFVSETDISNVQNKVQVTEGNSLFGSGG